MCAGTAEWSLQCRSRNVKIFSSTTLHQFHSEFVTRNWFRWQALQTKSGRRYPKITFYPVKANFLNNSRGGERDGRRGERGRETAPTRSATDRKIKEHDAVGSQGIVLRDAKERTGFAPAKRAEKSIRSHACITRRLLRRDCKVPRGGENSSETICSRRARGKYI